jgi:hypothetical protein
VLIKKFSTFFGTRRFITIHDDDDDDDLVRDIAIQLDRNVKKEAEKKSKYKNLSMEIQGMWNMKCIVMPVTIGAIGIIIEELKYIWKNTRERNL